MQKGPDHVWQNSLTGTNSPNEKYSKCMNTSKTNLDTELDKLSAVSQETMITVSCVNVVMFRNLVRENIIRSTETAQ